MGECWGGRGDGRWGGGFVDGGYQNRWEGEREEGRVMGRKGYEEKGLGGGSILGIWDGGMVYYRH